METMNQIWTVSQLNEALKELLEIEFGRLWVEGEVSNLRKPASGHVYFTLKDDRSQIRAVIFRSSAYAGTPGRASSKAFDLEEGQKILCRARLSVYLERGEYQLLVDSVEPLGLGALQKAFEQLKARLAAEDLFHPRHKKPLPFLPRRIGVVTSPTGAVIRDILEITGRRNPQISLLIAPCRVQGAEAPREIIRALEDLQTIADVDVIILARGGGSLEDLAPFNSEEVARAIFDCRIPVVSAIGHETDFTIADFVADLRAPTPSAAAELVTPSRMDLKARILDLGIRLANAARTLLERRKFSGARLSSRLRDPRGLIAERRFRIDDRIERIKSGLKIKEMTIRQLLANLDLRLGHRSPGERVKNTRLKIAESKRVLVAQVLLNINFRKKILEKNLALLNTLNPLAVLNRGFAVARTYPEAVLIRDAETLAPGGKVEVQVARGSFKAVVFELKRENGHEQGKI